MLSSFELRHSFVIRHSDFVIFPFMTPARFQAIEEIFRAALDHQPDQISTFLDTACGGDEVLRRRVEALLASRQRAASFIETSAVGLATKIIQNGQADSLVGQTIGHYKISESIGTGGMGEVYLAIDITAGRKAALKLLPMRFTGEPERLKRFQQEARAVVALNHPNILTVYEIGEDHSIHYIASELIEGETLRERLQRGPMHLSEALDVAIQVASALAAAHQAGIVHRDIKPENIMLRPDGYAKVLDFGIAKLAEQELPTSMPKNEALLLVETNLGSILGTVRYMSPEQACGEQIDKRTDIWSLGVVLYEMVTGHTPFTGDTPARSATPARNASDAGGALQAGPQKVMSAILDKEPPSLTRYLAHPSAELQQIISKTLRKDREERYHSAHEILHALKELRRRLEFKLQRAAAPLWLRWARSPVALVVMLLAAALALTFPFFRQRNLTTSLPPDKSIAVLPLQNLSEDKQNAFFADGVQDELLSNLSKIKELKVISRTSVMQYKSGTKRNLKEIAQQLGVNNVVEGSVRRSGDRVRVSVQLIDAQMDRHLWGENYDRTLADSLSLQGELARDIANAVGATLSPQEKARVVAKPTNNPAAYDAYLRARAIPVGWGFHAEGDVEGAIRLYQEAVKLDPNFTLAWAYLSIAQMRSIWKGFEPSWARRAAAKDSLNHALALDPNLPEVHLARGYNEQDDTRALGEFRQAEQGLPNSADVIEAIALKQRLRGHWDEAVAELRRAIELDPRNITASNNLALTYCAMRRFPEALATLDRILAWDPTNARALLTKADALIAIGDLQAAEPLLANPELPANRRAMYALFQRNYAAAVEILSKDLAVDRRQRDPLDILSLAFSQQLAGDIAAASATYKKAIESFRRELATGSGVEADTHIRLAEAYAGLGDAASAIAEGEKAMALLRSSKHPGFGTNSEDDMARIYAQLGDADHAIPMLKRLLHTRFGSATFLTPATLRFDPLWDKIRNDPRFQELTLEEVPVSEKSIAVLPFENLSNDEENAFFAGGVQDELLTDLARIADLKVIGRTSVMQYKAGVARNLRKIGRELGVAHMLEGSVQRSANRVRVNAQLVDARTDRRLWGQTYDRDLADVFAIQSEIAKAIADQLQAKLSPSEEAAIERPPTSDISGFDLYTRAKNLIATLATSSVGRKADRLQAIELLNQAVARDPSFFDAYCLLAWFHDDLYFFGFDHTPARLASAEAAIQAAFRLRPDAGEAHLARAWNLYHGYLDYDSALAELEIARQSLPNNSEVFELTAYIQRRQARWEESTRNLAHAIELDPRSVRALASIAGNYARVRRYAEAKSVGDRLLAIEPNDAAAKVARAFVEFDWKADTRPLHQTIDSIRTTNPAAMPTIANDWLFCALAERDAAAAKNALTALGENPIDFGYDVYFTRPFAEGVIARMTKDDEKAREAFLAARAEQEKIIQAQPNYAKALSVLGVIDASLGQKQEALHEGRRAVELLPVEKDALDGIGMRKYLAMIAASVGEKDLAFEQLNSIIRLPDSLSYGDLKLMPFWDPLRGDPRFEKILEESKNPVTLTTTLPPQKSIAVLPFENLSKDEENAFFAGGVQDEILNDLAKVADLKVISRTSVMKYKSGLERNLREIAKTLGVSHVVEGSVQRAGRRVRLNVQLIDARNDAHLWAEHYDRDFADVFAVQSEIAERIANQLRATLSVAEKAAIEDRPTADPVAYAYYTEAKAIGDRLDWEGWEKSGNRAIELLEKATQRDPKFALAYCALAGTQADLYELSLDSKHLELAKEAADTALRLRPDLGEAHLALAYYYFRAGFLSAGRGVQGGVNTDSFDQAREELAIAQRKLPNNSEALFYRSKD
ncbi:MAG TPA: protein kinase [Candidatus Udaeobacter sp.]|nr:protein kinase [Candidatus Udaeobacter sp.]